MNLTPEQDKLLDEAVKAFAEMGTIREARGITDEEMEAIYAMGVNFYKAGSYDNAEKVFRCLVLFDHSNARDWAGFGALMQARRKFDEAIKAYQYGMFLDIENPRCVYYLAECFLAKGEKDLCLETLRTLEAHCPKTTDTGRKFLVKGAKLKALAEAK